MDILLSKTRYPYAWSMYIGIGFAALLGTMKPGKELTSKATMSNTNENFPLLVND
jgi:hypothetical protein